MLCMEEPETVDHLFLRCCFSHALLDCLLLNKRALSACTSVGELWKVSNGKWGVVGRKELTIIVSTLWAI